MPTNAEIAILSQQRNQVLWCKSPIWKRARTTIAFCHFSARRFDSFCEFRVFRFPLTLFDILRIRCLHTVSYTQTHEEQRIPSDVAGLCSSLINSIMCQLTNILVGCVWIGVHSNISLSRHCFFSRLTKKQWSNSWNQPMSFLYSRTGTIPAHQLQIYGWNLFSLILLDGKSENQTKKRELEIKQKEIAHSGLK